MKKLAFILCLLFFSGFFTYCGTESKPVYILTIFVNGEGSISPSGGEYEEGETVTLNSIPDDGWVFHKWSGDASGTSNTLTFTMHRDINITANFQRRDYPLNINIEGEGTVNERIVSSKKSTDYPFETIVELTSKPNDGWVFYEWKGESSGDNNPEKIKIDDEKEVTSVFKSIDELLTIEIIGEGSVNIEQESFEEHPSRRRITLIPNVQSGWWFVQWDGDISSTDEEIEVIVDGKKNITLILEHEDIAFYEDFATQEGVEMSESGLLYRIIEEGDGNFPGEDNWSFVSYTGYSVDRIDEFDTGSNLDIILPKPSELDFFPGLAEGILLMSPGANIEIVLPSELAVGDGRVYYFNITLDSFLELPDLFLEANAENEDVIVTESGLQYRIIELGEGESPSETSIVNVNFKGTYSNGYVFDEGEDVNFDLDRTIQGFTEGLQLMSVGSTYELFLPAEIGYGNNPPPNSNIIPGAVLIFEVELLEVINQ